MLNSHNELRSKSFRYQRFVIIMNKLGFMYLSLLSLLADLCQVGADFKGSLDKFHVFRR